MIAPDLVTGEFRLALFLDLSEAVVAVDRSVVSRLERHRLDLAASTAPKPETLMLLS
jgi:hypothetical protein